VNSAEENRANFLKARDGKPLYSAIYSMYTVTLNELRTLLKVSSQAGQSGAGNKTSVESRVQQDDYRDIKRDKRHVAHGTSQTAKKSTKPVTTSAAAKLPPNSGLTRNFVEPLRINDMDTETTGSENAIPEQEASR
jgi:hypothetical protein